MIKKTTLILSLLLMCAISSQAQNTFPSTGNTGIGTLSPASMLDVKYNGGLINIYRATDQNNQYRWRIDQNFNMFFTNSSGTDVIRIGEGVQYFNSGALGIGTTSPAYTLDVNGQIRVQGNVIRRDDGTALIAGLTDQTKIVADGTSRSLTFFSGGSTTANERMRIDPQGKVGIGTTTPGVKLSVEGQDVNLFSNTLENQVKMGRNSSEHLNVKVQDQNMYMDYHQDSDNNGSHILHIRNLAAGSSIDNDIRFSTGGEQRLTIKTNGDLGIGTTTPSAKLSVEGQDAHFFSGTLQNQLLMGRASNQALSVVVDDLNMYFDLLQDPDENSPHTMHFRNLAQGTSDGNDIRFSTGGSERVTIDNGGYVGIGTSSPRTALHVFDPVWGGAITLESPNQKNTVLSFREKDTGGTTQSRSSIFYNTVEDDLIFDNYEGGDFIFRNIGSGNNVGIGTTSPNAKLEVAGKIRAKVDDATASAIDFDYQGGYRRIAALEVGGMNARPLKIQSSELRFADDSGTRMIIESSGEVGIGINTPSHKLEVHGGNIAGSSAVIAQGNNYTWTNGATFIDYNPTAGYGRIGAYDYSTTSWKNLTIGGGNLGIGTPSPSEKLEVNGNARIVGEIYSKKVKVSTNASNWPDYVFEPNYQLRTLAETEAFIKANKHLPEVPSAKEIEENGQDLGDVQAILLKKIEEMTLQMIEMNKRLEKLEKENKALKENEK